MLDPKVKAEWFRAMEEERYPKCEGGIGEEEDGPHCALGVLMVILGMDLSSGSWDQLYEKNGGPLTLEQTTKIYRINDQFVTQANDQFVNQTRPRIWQETVDLLKKLDL